MKHALLTSLLALLSLVAVMAAEHRFELEPVYDRWSHLPSDSLLSMGKDFLASDENKDSALVCYSIVSNRYYQGRQDRDELYQTACALVKQAYLYMYTFFDYGKSAEALFLAQELSEKNGFDDLLPYIYLNLANQEGMNRGMHIGNQVASDSTNLYVKAFYAASDVQDWQVLLTVLFNMLTHASEQETIESVRPEIDYYRQLKIPADVPLLPYMEHYLRGAELMQQQRYAEALDEFGQLDATTTSTDPRMQYRYQMQVCNFRASALFSLNRDEEALDALRMLYQIAEQQDMLDVQASVNQTFSKYYGYKGNRQLADAYQFRYLELKDSLLNHSRLQDVEQIRFLYELRKANEQMQQMAYEHRQTLWLFALVAVLAISALTVLFITARSYRLMRDKNKQLYRQNVEMLRQLDEHSAKYQSSRLADSAKQQLADSIRHTLETSDEIYKESFSLNVLAEMVASKPNYVSQVINEILGHNFNTLLNEYRIREACRRMHDTATYGSYTVEGFGLSVGFKSRSNFVTVFKRHTGMTPSEYMRFAGET